MFDFDALESQLKTAARATLLECLEMQPNEEFFAFLLTALDPPQWFGAAINSGQHHARVMQANSVSTNDPEEEHFRWQPCEWGEYESVGYEHFEKINAVFGEPSLQRRLGVRLRRTSTGSHQENDFRTSIA